MGCCERQYTSVDGQYLRNTSHQFDVHLPDQDDTLIHEQMNIPGTAHRAIIEMDPTATWRGRGILCTTILVDLLWW